MPIFIHLCLILNYFIYPISGIELKISLSTKYSVPQHDDPSIFLLINSAENLFGYRYVVVKVQATF